MVCFDDLFCYLVIQLAELARVGKAARHITDPLHPKQTEPTPGSGTSLGMPGSGSHAGGRRWLGSSESVTSARLRS